MTPYIPAPDPITPAWLTAVLRASGALVSGAVLAVQSAPTGAFAIIRTIDAARHDFSGCNDSSGFSVYAAGAGILGYGGSGD